MLDLGLQVVDEGEDEVGRDVSAELRREVDTNEPQKLVAIGGELGPIGRAERVLQGAFARGIVRKRQSQHAGQCLPRGIGRRDDLQTQAWTLVI